MAEAKSVKKILWAIDPFNTDEAVLKSAAWSIRALTKAGPTQVEPVYVWSWSRSTTDFLATLQKAGQEAIERVLTRIDVPGVESFRVVLKPSTAVRDEARELIAHAKETGAELIVVSSHGRKGVKRWIMGSFAETLSLYSDVPLFIVHPNWKRTPDFKTILFPTDFSEESLEAFNRILDFALERNSRVTLFHKVGTAAIYPAFDLAFTVQADYERAFQEELESHKLLAKELVQRGKTLGVRVNAVFDRSGNTTASQAILDRAKRLGSMIAMASHSGPISTVLLGSLSRKIVRCAKQPVWILHPYPKVLSKIEPLVRLTQKDIGGNLNQHGRGQTA